MRLPPEDSMLSDERMARLLEAKMGKISNVPTHPVRVK